MISPRKVAGYYSRTHRKWLIAGGVIVVLMAGIGYTVWSMNTWSAYEARYQGWQNDIKRATDTALGLPEGTDQEKTIKTSALASVASRIENEREAVCRVNGLVEWQHFISTYKDSQARCGVLSTHLIEVSQEIRYMIGYFNDEKILASLFADHINTSEELKEAVWDEQLITWRNIHDTIDKANFSIAFKPVKAAASEKTAAVTSAWQELINTSAAKNKVAFTEAKTRLNDSYGALSAIATTSSSEFKTVSMSLQTAYSATFK